MSATEAIFTARTYYLSTPAQHSEDFVQLKEDLDDQEFCKNVVCFSLTDSLQKADYNIFQYQ